MTGSEGKMVNDIPKSASFICMVANTQGVIEKTSQLKEKEKKLNFETITDRELRQVIC